MEELDAELRRGDREDRETENNRELLHASEMGRCGTPYLSFGSRSLVPSLGCHPNRTSSARVYRCDYAITMHRMRRTLLAVMAGSMLVLVGCGGSESSSTTEAGSSMASVDGSVASPGLALAPGDATRDQAPQAPQAAERKEVVTGQLSITTDDPIQAARDTVGLVEDAGGRIDNRTESPESGDIPASSSLTVRIPADELTGALDEIQKLGEVTNLSVSRDDVTIAYQDLDARISALAASVARLQGLIANATNTADLIEAESALSSRQGELDSLTSQKNYLADQVDLSTITVQFSTEDVAPPETGADSFWDGLVSGWNALVGFAAGALVVIGALLPWVAVLAVLALVVYGVVRGLRSLRSRTTRQARSQTDRQTQEQQPTPQSDPTPESDPALQSDSEPRSDSAPESEK